MKSALKINITFIAIIVAYLLIAVRGEVLSGSLGMFMLLGIFNNGQLIYNHVPLIGIILLIIAIFIPNKKILYAVALLCLYPNLILYIVELLHHKHYLLIPALSMIPFFILTVTAIFFVWSPIKEKT